MAVAGLHNVSVLNSSLSRESQSPVSRWWARDRPSTRASSLLQMWQELEVEHFTGHPQGRIGERPTQGSANSHLNNDSFVDASEVQDECAITPRYLQSENDDNRSSSSESIDFSEVQREKVREIFCEWRNSGQRDNRPNDTHLNNCSRAQWLGEKECERVRVVREWIEKTTQQRGKSHGGRYDQDAEIGAEIERVRDGLIVEHCEIGARRAVRKLCGRQALLDLLMRADRERKQELQHLLEHRHVSDFPHRNRIQSLLKGRFLRNKAYIQEERSSSQAASELGLLRQRHTVSGLREGFLSSDLDNSVRGPAGSGQSDSLSNDRISCHRNEQTQANGLQEIIVNECCHHPEPSNEKMNISISYTFDLESDVGETLNLEESATQADERHETLENEDREQLSTIIEFIERRSSDNDRLPESLPIEHSGEGSLLEPELAFSEGYHDPYRDERDVHSGSGDIDQLEGSTVEDLNVQLGEWQELVTENGDMGWEQLRIDDYSESIDGSGERIDMNSHDGRENSRLQVQHEDWHDTALLEAADNWSDEPSGQEVAPVDRIDTSYFSDDENGHNMELRELLSRRRVSNILRSDFRESLDQLIQSYVERQGNVSVDWELDSSSPSPVTMEQDQEQQIGDLHVGESEAVRGTPVILPLPQVTLSQVAWDHANRQQPDNPQQFGIELEIINELRIDMATLHQRMNSMQRMLEACMDMQLELQRSLRQEVCAALSRSSGSEVAGEDSLIQDESKWDHVKKGICCICFDASIDSLLYRCGHLCTCSKCADKLVQGGDKCPMCRAPVVEIIRAYFIQ